MRDCTTYRLCGLRRAPRIAYRRFRLLSLLLMVGMLAGSNVIGLHAQPGPVSDKKDAKAPKADPPAAPGGSSSAPQQLPSLGFEAKISAPSPQRFQFKIDPKTPLKDLLPVPPKPQPLAPPIRSNDLSSVPEVQFEAPQSSTNAEAMKHIAHQIAKINHLNDKKTDGFLEALRSERPDLTGLPFAMGDACRSKGERSKQFARAVAMVRQAMQPSAPSSGPAQSTSGPVPTGSVPMSSSAAVPNNNFTTGSTLSLVAFSTSQASVDPPPPETFWDQYRTLCAQQDKAQAQDSRDQRELTALSRIAALSQILLPMTQMHPGFAKYLSTVSHAEATRALARLAIFSADENARKTAVEALKVRRERDYTKILVNGLRYPWPAVARRSAEAIVNLELNDLLPQLIEVLEQDDPRAPATQEIKGKGVPVVRELVRVNHHRSCLLCHAPGNTGKVSADAVTAEVPVPGQPLNPPSGGYNTSQPDILVRVDVTYLRQDFSAMQAVADANPWPEMQRFDFLVRSRVLSDEEATAYRERLKPHEPGEFSPYQRAALAALRELTGRDAEPTPQAWRRLLKLPTQH